jgi:acetylornithine deacetylase
MDIDKFISQYCDEVIPLTQKLVSFPSINKPPFGQEGNCQKFIASWLKKVCDGVDIFEPTKVKGIESHPAYWRGRNYSGRPNVVGIKKGSGGGRSLLFNGHVDVVPDDPKPWIHDPFAGEIVDKRIYGRGSLDMKGGLAAAMLAIKIIHKSGIQLAGDVILESVVDEEYAGANGTLACILKGYVADAAISMEPTWMEIGTSMRSGRLYEIKATGIAGMPIGIEGNANPAYIISRMALGVEAFDRQRNQGIINDPLFCKNPWPLPAITVKIKAGQVEPGGLIGIPDQSWLHSWVYGLPNTNSDQLDTEVYKFFGEWIEKDPFLKQNKPVITPQTRFLDGSEIPQDHPIVKTITSCSRNAVGIAVEVKPVDVTGDNGLLVKLGNTPTICFGPGGSNLHAADEYVNTDDLINLVKIYTHTIIEWCKPERK